MRALNGTGKSRRLAALRSNGSARTARRRVAVLLAFFVPVVLVGCSLTGVDVAATYRGATPDGRQLAPLQVEPVYLNSSPVHVSRDNVFRYGCITGEPLRCSCVGRIGVCECQCTIPRRSYR